MAPAPPPPIPTLGKGEVAPSEIQAGSRLGKYEIIKRLAIGGMAEIFLARVEALPGFQKIVVIKRILPQHATKREFIEMFLDEARIAATLQHPNLVQVYDVGLVDGNYFISMEYLHGEDVRAVMKTLVQNGRGLPLEHALNICVGVAGGLHYAHEKIDFDGKPLEIVHRDVTPQNIIVTFEGGVKLLDFGIAKASNRSGETRFGTLKGKVPYMSPEQCRSTRVHRRTDVFSLGIMLYELTLGRRLFRAKSEFDVMKKIVDGKMTPPRKVDPAYDEALERIVMRALAKDRGERYQTAAEVQHDLERYIRDKRMYVSSTALKQFMESVFGHKLEAWREAQAAGKTLGEHLKEEAQAAETELGDGDLVELDEVQSQEAKQGIFSMEAGEPDEAEDGGLDLPAAPSMPSHPSLSSLSSSPSLPPIAPRRNLLPLAASFAVLLLLVSGALAWRVRHKNAQPPAPIAEVAPPPVVAPPPPAPIVDPAPRVEQLPAEPSVGIVKVTTTPAGATLFLDGTKLEEQSPATLDQIEATREHTLLVQLDGHKDLVEKFTVERGQLRPLELRLVKESSHGHGSHSHAAKSVPVAVAAPEPVAAPEVPLTGEGTLVVASSPWCNVAVDGSDKGQTPVSVKLPAGKHTVVLTNPEFKITRSLPVMILPNETLRKKLDFAQ